MTGLSVIDLEKLPSPDLIVVPDFEALLAEMKAELAERAPHLAAALELESDDLVKLLEQFAYRLIVKHQQVNDTAKSLMLAFAYGTQLDHLAVPFGVERKMIDVGDPDAVPPIPVAYENDEDFRKRIQLAPEALTTAGSEGAYQFHGLTAGLEPVEMNIEAPSPGEVVVRYRYPEDSLGAATKSVSVTSPEPGRVSMALLGHDGDGTLDDATVAAIDTHIQSVRALTDHVHVRSGVARNYAVKAVLSIYGGPDPALVVAEAEARFWETAQARHRLKETVTASVINAALHVAGVRSVRLVDWKDVDCAAHEAPYCDGLELDAEVEGEVAA